MRSIVPSVALLVALNCALPFLLAGRGSGREVLVDPLLRPEDLPQDVPIVAEGGRARVSWEGRGVLEGASSVLGPWSVVAGASPWEVEITVTGFYRVTPRYERPTSVHIPVDYEPATSWPLVLVIHGFGSRGSG